MIKFVRPALCSLCLLPLTPSTADDFRSGAEAAGFLDLYFKAPLLSNQIDNASTWDAHRNLSSTDVEELREVVWDAYREGQIAKPKQKRAFEGRRLEFGEDRLRFTIRKRVGKDPHARLPITISLHGGGAIPAHANDRQWERQQARYQDAPGIYVCPRAPRDTWNQWHGDYIYPILSRLIQELVLRENADPNRVYLMGYSAGGYGAFCIGAKMADRFAAVSASAAAPTRDLSPAENWFNTPLRFEIGENDIAYSRVQLCRSYQESLAALNQENQSAYIFRFIEHDDRGHQINDRACVKWLHQYQRDTRPKTVTWSATDHHVRQFYWLANEEPAPRQQVRAEITGNRIDLQTSNVHRLRLRLDDQLVNLDQTISVFANGMKIFEGRVARELKCLVKTLEERGDPGLMFCSEIDLFIP